MLEVRVEHVQVLGNICVEKCQSAVLVVQQDANPPGGDSNPDVWCHPAVQEFVLVPVGKKHKKPVLDLLTRVTASCSYPRLPAKGQVAALGYGQGQRVTFVSVSEGSVGVL